MPQLEPEQLYGARVPVDRSFDESLERELQEAMEGFSDKDLLGERSPREQRRERGGAPGAPHKGKVFRVHAGDVFIEIPGGRTQGVLPAQQFPEGVPPPGTEIDVHIEGFDAASGVYLLSRQGAAVEVDWSSVAAGMIVEARVTGTNKGGLTVDVNGIRGFLPISQLELFRVEDTAPYVNQRLRCLVTEVEPVMSNLVVSRRALLEKEREEARGKLWGELAEGQVRQGVVRSVKDFGAFVDLGGVDGLLHVSEMSWTRVADATKVVQPGQSLKVVVLKIDHERQKLSLGLKQLTASPWDAVAEKYHPGTVVAGKVSKLMDFGAFVELEPAVEGLIHISELSPQRVRRVADVVKEGQEVQVMVLGVDPAQRRISLSLKAAVPAEAEAEATGPAEETAPEEPPKPPRPRKTPLRGGLNERR
jgi:small subunit ribosomal protein S1